MDGNGKGRERRFRKGGERMTIRKTTKGASLISSVVDELIKEKGIDKNDNNAVQGLRSKLVEVLKKG